MSKLSERLGLDWLVILFKDPNFKDKFLPYPETLAEVREKFGDLSEQEKLNDAINYCTELLKREDNRSDKVESKAITLIGVTGIATGFITGFAGLLLDSQKITSTTILVIVVIVYIVITASLILTILLAVKVVNVRDYRFTYPSANDIFTLSNSAINIVKRERIASLFYSFTQNVQVVNRKAFYLSGAQLWFRNSIILLLLLSLFLAIYTSLKPVFPIIATPVPTSTPKPSDTPLPSPTPTNSSTPNPTATSTTIPTQTSTATSTQMPTKTSTATNTFTPVPTVTPIATATVSMTGTVASPP